MNTVNNRAVMSNRMCRSMGVDENKVAKLQFQRRRMVKGEGVQEDLDVISRYLSKINLSIQSKDPFKGQNRKVLRVREVILRKYACLGSFKGLPHVNKHLLHPISDFCSRPTLHLSTIPIRYYYIPPHLPCCWSPTNLNVRHRIRSRNMNDNNIRHRMLRNINGTGSSRPSTVHMYYVGRMTDAALRPSVVERISKNTLQRIQSNDRGLHKLIVALPMILPDPNDGFLGIFWPRGGNDMRELVRAIGKNTHLRSISFPTISRLPLLVERTSQRNLIKNNSVTEVYFGRGSASLQLSRRKSWGGLVSNYGNLRKLTIESCHLDAQDGEQLASELSQCTHLEELFLEEIGTGRGISPIFLKAIVDGKVGANRLKKLHLEGTLNDDVTLTSVGTILQDESWSLQTLVLKDEDGFSIDDAVAHTLADSLKGNKSLLYITLHGSDFHDSSITESGWNSFAKCFCDSSKANDIYLSNNNTLRVFSVPERQRLPNNLMSLLEMHSWSRSRSEVAIRKILRHAQPLDVTPLLEWDLKVLPELTSWFCNAMQFLHSSQCHAVRDEFRNAMHFVHSSRGDIKRLMSWKLSSMYQFARALPMMFVPTQKRKNRGVGRTRKSLGKVLHVLHPSHKLKPVKLKGSWACDGCAPEGEEIILSRHDRRFRCSHCDFDLCYECYTGGLVGEV